MFSLAPAIASDREYHETQLHLEYYCVEFGLNGSHPVYQFKLWHSDQIPNFFLVKETSALASKLKVGEIIPMKYYCGDTVCTIEQHHTRIESIENETNGRFEGHYRIDLSILGNDMVDVLQPSNTVF